MQSVARFVEAIVFNSRWLIAPFLLGLIVGLAALALKFLIKLFDFVMLIPATPPADVIVGILTLVDLTLIANLIVIVICSSYENFLTQIDPAKHPDWPEGLIKIGFSGLKQKLLGSIAAIAAVNVLEWFMDIERHADNTKLAWVVGILLAFAVSMLILAIADRLSHLNETSAPTKATRQR
ncbi:MAG TPA: YqhA family protein [Pseudolabrys sp.]|nr:YqhA family protein [Pseudolabrys sp.]